MNVFYIPTTSAFLKSIVEGLLHEYKNKPENLADVHLWLPTRRACRLVTDLFLDQSLGRPMILPRLRAIADIDDQELEILMTAFTGHPVSIPPAISSLERQVVLTQMIRARDSSVSYARASALSRDLAGLLDRVSDEGLSLDRLDGLVEEEFAEHWQLTLKFLSILRDVWPAYLKMRGMIDVSEHRSVLLRSFARYLQDYPTSDRMIIAGVSGSLPAVAELMKVVACQKQGEIILSGFDPNIDQDLITAIDPQHPFYEIIRLLSFFDLDIDQVKIWPDFQSSFSCQKPARSPVPFWLDIMRPAALSDRWLDLKNKSDYLAISEVILKNVRVVECKNLIEEAQVIAMHARQILQDPQNRLAIVTPDRVLARHIISACASHSIEVNDSGGEALEITIPAQFLMLSLKIITNRYHPVDILSLLRHPYFSFDGFNFYLINRLDRALRGLRTPESLDLLLRDLKNRVLDEQDHKKICEFFGLFKIFDQEINSYQLKNVTHLMTLHLQLSEKICVRSKYIDSESDISILWQDEAGESLSQFFIRLFDPNFNMPDIAGIDYQDFLCHLMTGQIVNRRGVGHPRLALLGIYESRLTDATHVVIASMNEDCWPGLSTNDLWLSRRMRKDFGLPVDEIKVGRSAHDFLQLVQADHILMTRSERVDGVVTVASRWLQRFDTVVTSLKGTQKTTRDQSLLLWVQQRYQIENGLVQLSKRPAPSPPLHLRPRDISATQFETLIRNPYAFFAQKILRLYRLDSYDMEFSGSWRGKVIHTVLARFMANDYDFSDDVAFKKINEILHEEINFLISDPARQIGIIHRLQRALYLYWQDQKNWQSQGYQPVFFEKKWQSFFNIDGIDYLIHARLDRLDRSVDGRAVIIDYKTSSDLPKISDMIDGVAPQLPIEAILIQQGSISGEGANNNFPFDRQVSSLVVWPIRSKYQKIQIISEKDLDEVLSVAIKGIVEVLSAYHRSDVPYYPLPNSQMAPRFDDYAHLSRRDEWWGRDI